MTATGKTGVAEEAAKQLSGLAKDLADLAKARFGELRQAIGASFSDAFKSIKIDTLNLGQTFKAVGASLKSVVTSIPKLVIGKLGEFASGGIKSIFEKLTRALFPDAQGKREDAAKQAKGKGDPACNACSAAEPKSAAAETGKKTAQQPGTAGGVPAGANASQTAAAQKGVKGILSDLWTEIGTGVANTVAGIKIDFTDLGGSLKSIFKSIGAGIKSALSNALNSLVSKGLNSLFGSVFGALGGLFGIPAMASGGRLQPGQLTLVGERGPELIMPDRVGTVVNAMDTGRMLTGRMMSGAAGGAMPTIAVPETKVIINNNSGAEARSSRRRGPDGGDIIDIVIGRVADNMARGGEIADAAALRFGLQAQGT